MIYGLIRPGRNESHDDAVLPELPLGGSMGPGRGSFRDGFNGMMPVRFCSVAREGGVLLRIFPDAGLTKRLRWDRVISPRGSPVPAEGASVGEEMESTAGGPLLFSGRNGSRGRSK